MEDKKYEAGRVEISSAEYRELVTDAVTNEKAAYEARNERWKAETERDKAKKELEEARAKIAELESTLQALQGSLANSSVPYNIPSDATHTKLWWNAVTGSSAQTATLVKEN